MSGLLIALAALIVGAGAPQIPAVAPEGRASIEFLDVGQGDATLIRSPEGKVALVDAGPDAGILKLLRRRDIARIDLLVLSHHHLDHYGGMDEVIREYRPTAFLVSDSAFTGPAYLKLLNLVDSQRIPTIFPSPDGSSRRIALGSVSLILLPQPPEDEANENNNSLGLRVQHGEASALLTGDSELAERRFWRRSPEARRFCASCDVLKLAHHGSVNGTDLAWLDLVRPRLAILSCGRENPFGHPHRETLALLARRGIPLRRTDRDGSIRLVSDGLRWRLDASGASPAGPRLVDLNTASAARLGELPGIGPAMAERIVAARPFSSVEDLQRVPGIGPKRLEQLRPLVTVEGPGIPIRP